MSPAPPRCGFCEAVIALTASGTLPDCCPRCLEPVPPPMAVAPAVRPSPSREPRLDPSVQPPVPPLPPIELELVYGRTGAAIRLALAERAVLGREAAGRELLGAIPQVSRQHCLVERDGDGLRVTDLGSTHGTFVGLDRRDCRSAPQPLGDSDLLQLGRERFLVRVRSVAAPVPGEAPGPASPPSVDGGYECSGCFDYRSPVPRFQCPRCHTANG